MDKPEIIMAPGPTPVPPEVLLAQGSPLVYHRGPGYGALLREVTEGLQKACHTRNDVLIFSSSGTGGLESAVANLFSPGENRLATADSRPPVPDEAKTSTSEPVFMTFCSPSVTSRKTAPYPGPRW